MPAMFAPANPTSD